DRQSNQEFLTGIQEIFDWQLKINQNEAFKADYSTHKKVFRRTAVGGKLKTDDCKRQTEGIY
ncbi:hypothetical protein, partial [Negadavirga shengliensis]